MSVAPVYASTKTCETKEEEVFYAKLDSVLDQNQCLGRLNAVNGAERAGYELCVVPHGSGTRINNSSFLLNLARSGRL